MRACVLIHVLLFVPRTLKFDELLSGISLHPIGCCEYDELYGQAGPEKRSKYAAGRCLLSQAVSQQNQAVSQQSQAVSQQSQAVSQQIKLLVSSSSCLSADQAVSQQIQAVCQQIKLLASRVKLSVSRVKLSDSSPILISHVGSKQAGQCSLLIMLCGQRLDAGSIVYQAWLHCQLVVADRWLHLVIFKHESVSVHCQRSFREKGCQMGPRHF